MAEDRESRWIEPVLIGMAAAALVSVVLANVIRVKVSPDAAVAMRAILFGASWIAATVWAVAAKRRAVLAWLGALAGCGVLIALCQASAGGVSSFSLMQLLGPAGAGIGVALLIERGLQPQRAVWTAWCAALFGCVAATWLALEPAMELWKLLPNDWEVSKNLIYRWGIRMGQERARFLFDTPMEAGVVQWLLGSVCLAAAWSRAGGRFTKALLGTMAILLFATVALTYSRAGIVLGGMSAGLAALMSIRTRRAKVGVCVVVGVMLPLGALVANHVEAGGSAALRNLTSIFDPAEEANRIRLDQIAQGGRDLAETPWHGRGPGSFMTFQDAPRMPEHENSPIGLIAAFGLGGLALVAVFLWQVIRRWRSLFGFVFNDAVGRPDARVTFLVITVWPFAIYSMAAPILAGVAFGMICFTIMGLLATWDVPPMRDSGKL